jgi:NADPH-dependent 2,4-dienoyl-CoA reductase/sulfur reductase-like enzyme
VARFLIVGGGKKVSALAEALGREGHALNVIEDADRLGAVLAALEHVAIVCWLVGASPERFLLGAVDSSMRGFLYEPGDWESIALETAARNSIPAVGVRADPAVDLGVWLTEVQQAIEHLLCGHLRRRGSCARRAP